MTVPVVTIERVERDTACRSWEIVLSITKDGEQGYYMFHLTDFQWREARVSPPPIADGGHGPVLVVEKSVPA